MRIFHEYENDDSMTLAPWKIRETSKHDRQS